MMDILHATSKLHQFDSAARSSISMMVEANYHLPQSIGAGSMLTNNDLGRENTKPTIIALGQSF